MTWRDRPQMACMAVYDIEARRFHTSELRFTPYGRHLRRVANRAALHAKQARPKRVRCQGRTRRRRA